MEQAGRNAAARLGPVGVWALQLRFGDRAEAVDATAELDALGYGAAWVPGGIGGDLLGDMARLLDAAPRIAVCSGILNVWKHEAADVGAWWAGLAPTVAARVLLGLGISHEALIGAAYAKPLATMRAYLDRLDAAGLPRDHLCLAALGPRMQELARDRTAGAHPYLVTPEHTAAARATMGPGPLLAPEQGVILETDPARARELARGALAHYRHLPNYVNNWARLGFSADEIVRLDDRLIDALFAWGDAERIAARVAAHHAAGADHVCVQVIAAGEGVGAAALLPAWRALAPALL